LFDLDINMSSMQCIFDVLCPVFLLCLHTHRAEALSDAFFLRLSVVHIGRNSRTKRQHFEVEYLKNGAFWGQLL